MGGILPPVSQPPFRVERYADVPLEFDGVLLADRSTKQAEDQVRWQEVRIYRTDAGKYVAEMVGRTTVEDEVDLRTVNVADEARDLHKALRRNPRKPRLSWIALAALEDAAKADPAVAAALTERLD